MIGDRLETLQKLFTLTFVVTSMLSMRLSGIDPIVGDHDGTYKQTIPKEAAQETNTRPAAVHDREGREHVFLPGLHALRLLANG